MITGKCIVSNRRDIEEVISAAPTGQLPMFEVVANRDEQVIGDRIYVKNGNFRYCMTDECVNGVQGDQVRFISYIEEPK